MRNNVNFSKSLKRSPLGDGGSCDNFKCTTINRRAFTLSLCPNFNHEKKYLPYCITFIFFK